MQMLIREKQFTYNLLAHLETFSIWTLFVMEWTVCILAINMRRFKYTY